jgi:hypothetical protein
MPLKYAQDELNNSKHRELDDLVFRDLQEFGFTPQDTLSPSPGQLAIALCQIVQGLPAKLDQKYALTNTAKQLIADIPELRDILQEAWTSGTFRNIRNLGTLDREC